ncbi:MAG TPA: pitrilysin family protein [Paludibacteraceae bacterium]|nr:pitrilysin family protein [Paludibacteraceae bacterium]HQB68926.1 pitrilysin family protein [Paludibacteraceae bacterium]HRS67235.1 pitrilysin family protein [Paludibacteraceae bacterium]
MVYQTHTLSNGIRLLHVPDASPITYCGFAVNAGTRDELDDEQGMAHFVEHMLFKGTSHRKSWHIINWLESVGGQIDAYTTKEETFVYATVPSVYMQRAMELLADIMFHSVFPAHELEREMDVVLDEIQSYNDSPAELIFDEFEELLFADSPIGRNILGNAKSLEAMTSQRLQAFVSRCYTTDQMVFFSLGNTDFLKLIRWAERLFTVSASQRSFLRKAPKTYVPQQITLSKDTFQMHAIVGNRAFELSHPDRVALVLLNNILGGPNMSSRLNMSIRERNGLAYSVESNVTAYGDTGVWSIYVGCDHKNTKRCLQLIDKELEQLRTKPLDARQLHTAKLQLEGQQLIANENKENLILAMAKLFLHTNHCLSDDEIHERIMAVTSEKLQQIAHVLFNKELLTHLIFN